MAEKYEQNVDDKVVNTEPTELEPAPSVPASEGVYPNGRLSPNPKSEGLVLEDGEHDNDAENVGNTPKTKEPCLCLTETKLAKYIKKYSAGGDDGAEVNIIKFSGVALNNGGTATITPTAEQFTTMSDTTEECIVVIQFTSGAIVTLNRVVVGESRVIFSAQHSTTEYVEDATAVFVHVDGNDYYTGGVVVSTMLEANITLDAQTEYADLDNITVNGETYLIPQSSSETIVGLLENQDISVKNVTSSGNITANSIIENMEGYSFVAGRVTGYSYTNNYAGAVKNGNKLTFVISLSLTKTSSATDNNPRIGSFIIPSAIGDKLISYVVGNYNYLDNRVIQLFASDSSYLTKAGYIVKQTNTRINFVVNTSSLVVDTAYHLRYEATFLLNDNLAQ